MIVKKVFFCVVGFVLVLPAEVYAIKYWYSSREILQKSINTFVQLKGWVFLMIGVKKLPLIIQNITNGHSGFFSNFIARA
jgi:uncharacterized membrane protein